MRRALNWKWDEIEWQGAFSSTRKNSLNFKYIPFNNKDEKHNRQKENDDKGKYFRPHLIFRIVWRWKAFFLISFSIDICLCLCSFSNALFWVDSIRKFAYFPMNENLLKFPEHSEWCEHKYFTIHDVLNFLSLF